MAAFLRYTGIVLGVLLLAVVLMACGEGACGVCVHSCCAGSDRVDRHHGVLGRVLTACAASGIRMDALVAQPTARATHPIGGWLSASLFATGVSALRI